MGVASLVLGIVGLVAALIPACGIFIGAPIAVVGIILGAVDMNKKKAAGQPYGQGKAGMICSIIALSLAIIWTLTFGAALAEGVDAWNEAYDALEYLDY